MACHGVMGRVGSRNYHKPEPGSKARDSSEFPVADSKVFSLSVQEKGSISFFIFSAVHHHYPSPQLQQVTSYFLAQGSAAQLRPFPTPAALQSGELCLAHRRGVRERCLQPPPPQPPKPAPLFTHLFIRRHPHPEPFPAPASTRPSQRRSSRDRPVPSGTRSGLVDLLLW